MIVVHLWLFVRDTESCELLRLPLVVDYYVDSRSGRLNFPRFSCT